MSTLKLSKSGALDLVHMIHSTHMIVCAVIVKKFDGLSDHGGDAVKIKEQRDACDIMDDMLRDAKKQMLVSSVREMASSHSDLRMSRSWRANWKWLGKTVGVIFCSALVGNR